MSGSSAYIPPHLRAQASQPNTIQNLQQQDRQTHFVPNSANQAPNYQRNRNNANISRSRSLPVQLNTVADSVIEERFAQNEETTDMSVYDGAEVTVHTNGAELEPIQQFPGCGIRNEILLSVAEIGFKLPTSVQKYAIPYILSHHDVSVTSQTGSG